MPRPQPHPRLVAVLAGGLLLFGAPLTTASASTPAAGSHAPLSDANTARRRIAELRSELARHDALYFKHAAPEITDAAYDALQRELRALEHAFPAEAAALAPTPPLTDDHTAGFAKAAHREPMLSLDKAYNEAELRAACARITAAAGPSAAFVIEPKIDGLAVSATYAHGRFVRAVTRGDGRAGDDITANALALRSLPRELRATAPDGTRNPIPDHIELRGEIYLSHTEFLRLNRAREADGEPPLAHPRNVAAGTIKSHDPQETAARRLDIVFYAWGACDPATVTPATQQSFHAQAKAWGLPVLETYQIAHDADAAWAAVQALGQRRTTLAAPTDGVVIKLDAVPARLSLGETDHAPHWAFAYKFAPERATAQLLAITVQVGRTGLLTPVAEFTPVTLGGSTVARATLHNRDAIARLDLRAGDSIYVEKSGEIIPEIVGVDLSRRPPKSQPYAFPSQCPACGATVLADEDEAAVRCPNATACPAQLRQRLAHFAGKTGVNIKGLGEATIAELVARGQVRHAADLYTLRAEALAALSGLGEKSSANLFAEIARSSRAELWRFIHGLSLPRVGPATAKILARHFGSLEKLAAAQPTDFPVELGNATASALQTFFSVPENRAAVLALAKAVQPSAPPSGHARLAGKTFVLTGRLPTLSREEATRRIEAAGGKVRDSVSKTTDYVVAGTEAGEKLAKAKTLNVPVLDEAALLELLADK